jgi:hypothetical protein
MITRKQATLESVTAVLRDPSMMFVLLVGWMTLVKSLFFLFLPPEMEAGFFLGQFHYQELFYLYGAVSLVLGMYLTYGGLKSRSH